MKLKPTTRMRRLVAFSATVAALGGIALAQTTPALADPTETYIAVGSDTTQDVIQQWTVDLTSNTVGSYNAVNPVTATGGEIVTPTKTGTAVGTAATNCSFTRPNGSGQGLSALRKSINQSTTATQLAAPPQAGCIDLGRSSSGPATSNLSTTGALVYIPFALDGVAGAVGPATGGVVGGVTTVATNITQAGLFTLTDLTNLYKNCTTVTEGGVTYNPNTASAGQQQIDLYIPQSGSGTRTFWGTTLGGFNTTTLPACVHDTIVAGPLTGQIVEEHDGKAVATDPNGFGPFSISQWIGQRNGHNDRRHGAVPQSLNGVSPFTGTPASGTLNKSFPVTREVYNIVAYDRVVQTNDGKFDSNLAQLLAGPNSALCQDQFTITGFGFALLGAGTTDACGATTNSLRVFDPATNPV